MTAGFHVNNQDDKIKLRVYLDRYRNKEYKETPLLDNFKDICKVVAQSYEGDNFKA